LIIRSYATVSGGYKNEAKADRATVGGGEANVASASRATVGGGRLNQASGALSTVGGGQLNIAAGEFSFSGGGVCNAAMGKFAVTIGAGAKAGSASSIVLNAKTSSRTVNDVSACTDGDYTCSDNGVETVSICAPEGLFLNGEQMQAQGLKGDAGTNGTNGVAGTNGTNGVAGTNGTKGDAGADGAAGTNGTNGAAGVEGPKGETGPAANTTAQDAKILALEKLVVTLTTRIEDVETARRLARGKADVKPAWGSFFRKDVVDGSTTVTDTVINDDGSKSATTKNADGSTTVTVTKTVTNTDGSKTEVVTETNAGDDSTTVTLTDANSMTTITVSDYTTENVKAIGATLSTVSVENAKTLVNELVLGQIQRATTVSSTQRSFAITIVTEFTAVQLGGRTQDAVAFVEFLIKSVEQGVGSQGLSTQQATFLNELKDLLATLTNKLDSDGNGIADVDEPQRQQDMAPEAEPLAVAEAVESTVEVTSDRKLGDGVADHASNAKKEVDATTVEATPAVEQANEASPVATQVVEASQVVEAAEDEREAKAKQTSPSSVHGGNAKTASKKKGRNGAKEAKSKKTKNAKGSTAPLASDWQSGAAPASSIIVIAALAAGLAFVAITKSTTQKATGHSESQPMLSIVAKGKLPSSILG